MRHQLSCRCGAVKGFVEQPERRLNRTVCYCLDCQAFARFLGKAAETLDSEGGTAAVAVLPSLVTFTQGQDRIACMSLSDRGLLRWYSTCCRTAIGNTPRNFKLSLVSLVHTCLENGPRAMDLSFGPIDMRLNTKNATGMLAPMTEHRVRALVRTIKALTLARVSGTYRHGPFFDTASGTPRAIPHVLNALENRQLRNAS